MVEAPVAGSQRAGRDSSSTSSCTTALQGGVPVDLDPIRELCDRHGITVIEDAALELGFNYRMTDLQAAVGTVLLGPVTQVVKRRREIAARYTAGPRGIRCLRFAADPLHGTTNLLTGWSGS